MNRYRIIGDPILTSICPPIDLSEKDRYKQTIKSLKENFDENLLGLSANQIGIPNRIFIIRDRFDLTYSKGTIIPVKVFINPEVVSKSEETFLCLEACASVPTVFGWVERPLSVIMRAFDEDGKEFYHTGNNMEAGVLMHELDHLDGKLFVSLLNREQRRKVKRLFGVSI